MKELFASIEIITEDASRNSEFEVVTDMLLSDAWVSGIREFRAMSVPFLHCV